METLELHNEKDFKKLAGAKIKCKHPSVKQGMHNKGLRNSYATLSSKKLKIFEMDPPLGIISGHEKKKRQ